jgi:hypothetical protein
MARAAFNRLGGQTHINRHTTHSPCGDSIQPPQLLDARQRNILRVSAEKSWSSKPPARRCWKPRSMPQVQRHRARRDTRRRERLV